MTETVSEFQPTTQAELCQFLTNNAANGRRRLNAIGGATTDCQSSTSDAIDVRLENLNRVIDFPARDMTITVEAGIRMAELTKLLATENLRLPIDVPQAEHATLGGVIATNWSGARRFGCGTMRDYVIGISAVDATGREFKAGGRVVKNVAGYDLCKLLVGSRGTLAFITQVTLKLRPIPETSALVRFTFDSLKPIDSFLERLLTSATRPIVLDVLASPAAKPQLIVGYEGAVRETNWQIETLLTESRPFEPLASESLVGSAADPLWKELRDFVLTPTFATIKGSFPPSRILEFTRLAADAGIVVQTHAGNGIVVGRLPSHVTTAEQASLKLKPLREFVRTCGGSMSVLSGPSTLATDDSMNTVSMSSLKWSKEIQQQLDPLNLLAPGNEEQRFDSVST